MFGLPSVDNENSGRLLHSGKKTGTNTIDASETDSSVFTVPQEVLKIIFTSPSIDQNSLLTFRYVARDWRAIGAEVLIELWAYKQLPLSAEKAKQHKCRSEEHVAIANTVYKIISTLAFLLPNNESLKVRVALQSSFERLDSAMRLENFRFTHPLSDVLHNFSDSNPNAQQILPLLPTESLGTCTISYILEHNRRFELEREKYDISCFAYAANDQYITENNRYLTGNGAHVFFPWVSLPLFKTILDNHSKNFFLKNETTIVFSKMPVEDAHEKFLILGNWYKTKNADWSHWPWHQANTLYHILGIADHLLQNSELKKGTLSIEMVRDFIPENYSTWEKFGQVLQKTGVLVDKALYPYRTKFWS